MMSIGKDCLSTKQESLYILSSGWALLLSTLFLASAFDGRPLDQLGKQSSKARNLQSLLYYFLADGVGVVGYDPLLGALSPPLRLMVHVSFSVMFWSLVLFFWPSESFLPNMCIQNWHFSLAFLQSGFAAIMTYFFSMQLCHTWLPGVSKPPGPRAHRIQQIPKWPDKFHVLPSIRGGKSSATEWRHACAQDSHSVTDAVYAGTAAALTGDPTGRDIWTTLLAPQQLSNKKIKVDERIVQELASGGRHPEAFNPAINPNSADMPFRAQMIRNYLASGNSPPNNELCSTVRQVLHKAVHFYSMLQTDDGHWAGDYGGPLFLMPGLIIAWFVMEKPGRMFNNDEIMLMRHYMVVHQQVDGGWGAHIESPSTMFGTVLNYVALRLLGMEKDDPICQQSRTFIKNQGGAIMTSSWAKFYLCLLGCMHWDGHNSVPPEMWLLPRWFPFHPSRMWCHARMVYLPMGYLYGTRFVYANAETDPVVLSLREELYCEPYDVIKWTKTRHMVAPMDNYSPILWVMKWIQNVLACYELWPMFQPFKAYVRTKGLAYCVDYMATEDIQTNFIDIGPVNKVLNMISAYHVAGGDVSHTTVMNHMARVQDYLWLAEDGIKMKGYNGSQNWDTSFAIQAIHEAGLLDQFPEMSKKAWGYLEHCQIFSSEISKATSAYKFETATYRCQYFRHASQGGWPFSTSAHGWPISDCTGEGLKAVLCLLKSEAVIAALKENKLVPIPEERLKAAADILLTYQNEDGGWPTYENNRGHGWYELLNPSEVFGDIMIDYSYVETTMAAATGLIDFRERIPHYRENEISAALSKAKDFIKSIQRNDGSWYGSWACCFCYGSWFGIEGLIRCGEPKSADVIKKACDFLLRHQRVNGGWGEDFTSCYNKDYAADGMIAYGDEGSGVVNTSWALLALAACDCQDVNAVKKGVKYLMKRQRICGDWPQEGIAGVFNRACGITYTAYRNVFPIWALGRCHEVYGDVLDDIKIIDHA